MKKIILAIAIVAFTTIGAQAQDAKPTLSIGINGGFPISSKVEVISGTTTSLASIYSIAFGADIQADFAVAPTTQITASAGYENFSVKSKYSDLGFKSTGIIPLLAGAKFLFGEDSKLYGHAQIGYGIGTQKGSKGSFAYAPSIGYYFSPNVDGSIKYLAFSNNGNTTGLIGLRIAYNF